MRTTLFCLLCTFIVTPYFGQQDALKRLEALKKEIRQSTYYDSTAVFAKGKEAIELARKNKLTAEEGIIYQYYGNFYFYSYNIDKAKENYKRSIDIAKKANDYKLVNSTKIRLAFIESEEDMIAAENSFNSLLTEAKGKGYIENQIEIFNGLGNIYADKMIKDSALNYYLKGLNIADKYNKKYHQAMLLNNIGLLKFSNDQVNEAQEDFKRATELLKGMGEDRLMLHLNNNLGLVTKDMKKYKESVKYYLKTVENARILGFPQARSVAYLNLADSYYHTKDYKSANIYVDSAISMLKTYNEFNYLGLGFAIKGQILKDQNKIGLSKLYADSILYYNKTVSSPTNVIEYHRLMSSIYEKDGDFKLALEHINKYHDLKDSLEDISNKDKLSELQVIYGKERMESELINEKNKNSLLSKENELKRARLNSYIIISILVLIAGLGAMYLRHVFLTRKQQAIFTQRLIENTDDERSRISKDLHDDIGQSLSVIKSKLNMFNSGKITSVDGLEKEVGDVIEQTREISHSLHPSAVAKMGLERSVVSLLERTQSNTNIVSSIYVKNNIETLPIDVKTQVYRIIKECINNTVKHANASALKVSMGIQDDSFTMTYRDNGTGISEDKINNEGIGMMTIRERAKSINGKIQINSSDKGFKLILTLTYST